MREYMKKARVALGMSQQNVADAVGVTRQYYQQIESGSRQSALDISLATKLASILHLSLEQISDYEKARN